MVINIDSLSFSSIYNNFIDYFGTQAQSQKWKDFYESTMGKMFMRLLSGFGAFISYMVTVARREVFLNYAQNTTSLIGIAENLGYSVSRGKNEIISIEVTPIMTGLIPEYTVVGTVNNVDLVTTQEVMLTKNVPTVVQVYLGNLNSESIVINSDQIQPFRFTNSKVSDYINITLNGNIVPFTNSIKDLSEDTYIAISNPLGSVDVCYLQGGNYTYKATDILTVQYIELIKATYTIANINFDYGNVTAITNISPYTDSETNNSIVVKAPLYHETQLVIRGRADYQKVFQSLGYNLASTNSTDYTPAIVDLTYVKGDYTIMSSEESSTILNSLDNARGMGIPLPRIYNPNFYELNLNFNVKILPSSATPLTNVQSDVNTLTSSYEKSLQPTVDLESIEHNMDENSYVKRSRVSVASTVRANNATYRLGDFITTVSSDYSSKIYMAYAITKNSGSQEPTWTYHVGDLVMDNGLVWRCVNKYNKNAAPWYANRFYKIGDLVKNVTDNSVSINYLFECISINHKSGFSIPNFSANLGDFTDDNEIVWNCKTLVENDPAWQANAIVNIGDSIKSGTFSYECIGFRGTSANMEPKFKITDNYPVGGVNISTNQFTVSGDLTNFIRTEDIIQIRNSTGNDGYYTVSAIFCNGTNTYITITGVINSNVADGHIYLQDTLTVDGNILWQYYNPNETSFSYDWNAYVRINNHVVLS